MTIVINKKTYEAGELVAYVERLEKENAELKKQLEQAKEIIKAFLLMAKVEHLKDRYETVDDAEAFLKEIKEND